MLGFINKPKPNFIGPDISKAVQRNEQAATEARRALEELRYSDTMRKVAGKMQ